MKNYDYQKTLALIEQDKDSLESVTLGMHEDWFWTAVTVFENGELKLPLKDEPNIAGIKGSTWSTPTIQLTFKNGDEKMLPCYIMEGASLDPVEQITTTATMQAMLLGVLSGPAQDNVKPLD